MHTQVLSTKKRYFLLDSLRGFMVLCMVFYHGFLSADMATDTEIFYPLFEFFTPVEPFFAGGFILLSGVCCRFSHSNLLRGVKCLVAALLVNAVTVILDMYFGLEVAIYFGILNLLSFSMIFVGLLEKPLKKIPPLFGLVLTAVLFVLTFIFVLDGYKYIKTDNPYLFPLGIVTHEFSSADYFPVVPWLFLYLTGFFIGKTGFIEKHEPFFIKGNIPFLTFLGRKAIIIYIVHQPVIFGIFYLIGRIIYG